MSRKPTTRSQGRTPAAGPSTTPYAEYTSRIPFERGETEGRQFESFTAGDESNLRSSTPKRRRRSTRKQSDSEEDSEDEVEATAQAPLDPVAEELPSGAAAEAPAATAQNNGEDEEEIEEINPEEVDPRDKVNYMLTRAITELTRTTRSFRLTIPTPAPAPPPPPPPPPRREPPRKKVREPDQFDGSDPKKLRTFFVHCEVNFRTRPHAFPDEADQVLYAVSYLKGPALDLFEPDLLRHHCPGQEPRWMSDWERFVHELERNFGPHDAAGEAEELLLNITMKDGQRIGKYVIEFNRYAGKLDNFGEGALRALFYRGLPDRIKDEITRFGKPSSLYDLRDLAEDIDGRHWERKAQTERRNKPAHDTDHKPSHKSSPAKNQRPSAPSSTPTNSTPKDKESNGKPKSDLAAKLGKDGKLTKEERQRRFENKLCMFCGKAGHIAKDCYKSGSSSTKARAAKVATPEPEPESDSSSDAKN